MPFFKKILDALDLDKVVIAGFLGALFGLLFLTEVKTFKQKLALLLFGTVLSYYFAEPAARYFHMDGPKGLATAGFGVGLIGYTVLQAVFRSLKSLDIVDLLKNAVSQAFDKITGRAGGGSDPK